MGMDVGSSGSGKKGRSHPEMNVTPLVDVVLVLLIIFMVVTPTLQAQFWIHLPNKPEENQPPPPPQPNRKPPIVVSVTPDGQIRINREIVPDAEFETKLHRVLAASGDRKIFFDASNDAPFGRAVAVLDMARAAGAANIAVMTQALDR